MGFDSTKELPSASGLNAASGALHYLDMSSVGGMWEQISYSRGDSLHGSSEVRGHWEIENRLHWVRDVTFDEDRCQIRTGAAPQVMAALCNLVIGMFRLNDVRNIAAALRIHAWHARRAIALVTTPQRITQ